MVFCRLGSAIDVSSLRRLAPGMFCYTFELDRLIADICYFVDEEEVSTRVRNQRTNSARFDHACQTGDGLLDF